MKKKCILFLIYVLFCLSSCVMDYTIPEADMTNLYFDQEAYDQNLQKWENLRLQDYYFEYDIITYMPTPIYKGYVTVSQGNGSVVLTEYSDETTLENIVYKDAETHDDWNYFTSMEDVFDYILESYKADKAQFDKEILGRVEYTVEYNSEYGFPKYVYIYTRSMESLDEQIAGDSGLKIKIQNFRK